MRIGRTTIGVVGGLAAAALVFTALPGDTASAKGRKKGRNRGVLRMVDISVDGFAGIPQNFVVEMRFTATISKASIIPALFQIRGENAASAGFTKQVAGDFQPFGNVIRFFPRLPTHLRDPEDPAGGFYPVGTARDDANENSGFQPDTNYQITLAGNPRTTAIRSKRGRKLNRDYQRRFTTAPNNPRTEAFTIETYTDAPPPGFQFSNPPDKVAGVPDQYALHGGASDVPNAISVTLFGNKVPLAPDTVRQGSNVTLRLLERAGDVGAAKPIAGTPFIEQNYDTTRLVFQPFFPLPDRGVYALRVTKNVKDLTEIFTYKNNPERLRLREIYDFLTSARNNVPIGTPASQLADPPIDLIFDWPQGPANAAARGVLKVNLLNLGDSFPEETDPRIMVLFSTRDEPVSEGVLVFEYEDDDGLFDADNSTASWDSTSLPGTVAAISTIAGGSAVDGDYKPVANETISIDSFPNREINWRRLFIPPGVTVTITGSRPASIKALELEIQGTLSANGRRGDNATTGGYKTSLSTKRGGAGGPGGGEGGDASRTNDGLSGPRIYGGKGEVGVDVSGFPAIAGVDGGDGGGGGSTGIGTYYRGGGGGGGGGARTAGTAGAKSTFNNINGWGDGLPGAGGSGSVNDDLDPLVGGAGGGAGGNGSGVPNGWTWSHTAGAGGGGGGAVLVQTASIFTVGSQGVIEAIGGVGGKGSGSTNTLNAGPGGGAGGGSLLLRSTAGFNFADPGTNTDVRGGSGGTQTGRYTAPFGGTGGAGYIRTEDPFGGTALPGGSVGEFNPVGGGLPSRARTLWADIGVEGPTIVNFTKNDFALTTAGNDAILVEAQFAIEDDQNFGKPLLNALDANGNTTNEKEISVWRPIRIKDDTGIPGGAFGPLPDYDPGVNSNDYVWEIASRINGSGFKFVRLRFTFQLDEAQSVGDPFPNIDRTEVHFLFNN